MCTCVCVSCDVVVYVSCDVVVYVRVCVCVSCDVVVCASVCVSCIVVVYLSFCVSCVVVVYVVCVRNPQCLCVFRYGCFRMSIWETCLLLSAIP